MTSAVRHHSKLRPGLFVRIYVTLVFTVLAFVLVSGVAVWGFARSYDRRWSEAVVDELFGRRERILDALEMRHGLRFHRLRELSRELSIDLAARVRVRPARWPQPGTPLDRGGSGGSRGLESAPNRILSPMRLLQEEERRCLRRGEYVVKTRGVRPPLLVWPVLDDAGAVGGVVFVDADTREQAPLLLGGGLLFLVALGGAAWGLARSLTRRLAALEVSTRAFAAGALRHRAAVAAAGPGDEINRLACAFNDMAQRIEDLVTGQRRLLTNVSHELKTPLARIRVLVELLGERTVGWESSGDPHLARMAKGMDEIIEDLDEIEALVGDLLTSGRLELGRGSVLVRSEVDFREVACRAAHRHGAIVRGPEKLAIWGDQLLMERLISNLLSNARRACPSGEVAVSLERTASIVTLEVVDDGPGLAADQREMIFEPFARLDEARDRGSGGIGLGLFLCRQIVLAHGGSIEALARVVGRGSWSAGRRPPSRHRPR
ncbi:MAG: HAMP domain-containing sensor histidine kinase [Nannocystaceae bacterium]